MSAPDWMSRLSNVLNQEEQRLKDDGVRDSVLASGKRFDRIYKDRDTGELMNEETYKAFLHEKAWKAEIRKDIVYRDIEIRGSKGVGRKFIMIMTDKTKEASHQMSASTLGAVMMILGEVHWSRDEDTKGMLINEKGRPMKVIDFEQLFGKKKRVVMRIIKDLKDIGFLTSKGETTSTVYFVNPTFHVMGKSVEKGNFVRLYTQEFKELTRTVRLIDGENRRISPDALGFFYMLMPYVHIRMNAIVHNPNEIEPQNINLALKSELHELTGVSRNTVSKYMKELGHFGVLATLEIYGKKSIIPNPKYLYRGDDVKAYKAITLGFQEIMDAIKKRDEQDMR